MTDPQILISAYLHNVMTDEQSAELKDWLEIFGPVALTGKPVSYEMYSPSNQRCFEGTAYSPAPGQFAATFYDVTERKSVEDALRTSEEKLHLALEGAIADSWEMDLTAGTLTF